MVSKINFSQSSFWIKIIIFTTILFVLNYGGYTYFKNRTIEKELTTVIEVKEKVVAEFSDYFSKQITAATDATTSKKNPDQIIKELQKNVAARYVFFVQDDGTISHSTIDKLPVKTNVFEQFKKSSLGDYLKQAPILFNRTITHFEPFLDEPTLFLAVPFLANQKYSGSYVIALDTQTLQTILNQHSASVDDILVGIESNKKALLIFNTKHDGQAAFKTQFSLRENLPINEALKAHFGSDIAEVNGKKQINARAYLLQPQWAIVVQQDLHKVLWFITLFKYTLWLLGVLVVLCIVLAFYFLRSLVFRYFSKEYVHFFLVASVVLFLLFSFAFSFVFKKYRSAQNNNYDQELAKTKLDVEYVAASLYKKVYELEAVGHSLALDCNSGKLNKNNFQMYAQQVLSKNKTIVGLLFDSSYFYQKDSEIKQNSYAEKPEWLVELNKINKPTWYGPLILPEFDNKTVIIYSEPCKTGIIALAYPFQAILDEIANLGAIQKQNSVIFTNTGKIIFPLLEDLTEERQFTEIINEISDRLHVVQERGAQGYSGKLHYVNKKTNEKEWAIYTSIPTVDWSLVVFASDSYFYKFTPILYQFLLWLLMILTATFFFACVFLTKAYLLQEKSLALLGIIFSFMLIFGIFFVFSTYYQFSKYQQDAGLVTNKIDLQKIVESNESQQRIPIKTGITIDFLKITDSTNIPFIAHVWQTYNTQENPDLKKGVKIKNISGELKEKEISKTQKDGLETIVWEISGYIYQLKTNYSKAPFDTQSIDFVLVPKDENKNVFLELDINAYKNIEPSAKPGLAPTIKIDNFAIVSSFFSYKDNQKDLTLTVNLKRNVLSSFVNYLLPIFTILLTLYILSLYLVFTEGTYIAIYAGLFFSLILLHQNYRSSLHITETSFLDYVIFTTYIAITASYLDNFLTKKGKLIRVIVYWPLLLTIFFVITLLSFYTI